MKNEIIQGDCLEVMKDIPDKSIDMILCDLPYGTTACRWDVIIPFEPLWKEYKRIIKDNGAIVLTASQPFTSALVMSNVKMFKYEIIWEKGNFANQMFAKVQPLKIHENIVVFSKGLMSIQKDKSKNMSYFPQGLMKVNKKVRQGEFSSSLVNNRVRRVKEYMQENENYPKSIVKYSKDGKLHPTQKPVALFEYLIKTYTNEGDLVLDNCAGSGTTGVACKNLGRDYILIEKEPEYVKIINERLGFTTLKEEIK